MQNENAIEASNLTKNYGNILAVDHINFNVKKGEIFGFLGPNGAGKTTTLRMLTGVSTPTDGSAKIMGYDIQRESVKAKELMGIVPESSNIYAELSAWDNLIFTGRLYDIPKVEREERATELLKIFGLYERREQKVEGFSKGMKRRVCVTMALMNNASILFLDEPTSGLDVQSVLTIRNRIRELNNEGLTIFVTTHNMEEASQMCDRIAIINRGSIAAIDTPEKLKMTIEGLQSVIISFDNSVNNAVSDFKAFNGVNHVTKEGDKIRLTTNNPSQVLIQLWDYVKTNNLKVITLNTVGPSLEDVFIKLTGLTTGFQSKNLSGNTKGRRKNR